MREQINYRNIAIGLAGSLLVSLILGVGGALLNAWNDLSTLSLRVNQAEQEHARLREWLVDLSKRTDYYHGVERP